MAGVYDFDKTILAAYNQGHNRGVEMVNMAEKRNQFKAIHDLRKSAFKLQKDQYDRGIIAQKQFTKAYNDFQASKQKQKTYNKGVEKEISRVKKLQPWNENFFTWDTFWTQMGFNAPTAEELYKKRMEREGTPELGIKPERYQLKATPEMAGQLQLFQLLSNAQGADVRNESLMDLIYQSYEY
jgi:hypothetical protein|tara:strand:+ start:743 stop:1291 length:549 start_codon:yes stop_codon:yes gene_type:complete